MTDTAAARPLGDPFGEFAVARTTEQVYYAGSAALSYLIGYIGDGASMETADGRARIVAMIAAIEAERYAAYARILGRTA